MSERPTFEQLLTLEPRLGQLFARAKAIRHSRKRFPTMAVLEVWYGPRGRAGTGLKKEVCRLVGYTREEKHPVLSTSEAYDVAYDTILSALRGDLSLENP